MKNPRGFASLFRVAAQYVLRRGAQSMLMILGVALGVAVMVSIDLANASAGRAFELSSESLTGKATHQITASGAALNEQVYIDLRRSGLAVKSAPVISGFVSAPAFGAQPVTLLGFDVFVDRDFHAEWQNGVEPDALLRLLSQPGAVLISSDLAQQSGLKIGDRLPVDFEGRSREIVVAGVLQPSDDLTRRSLSGVLLADIATVQEVTGRFGQLDRIDLILADGGASAAEIQRTLPPGVTIETTAARQGSITEMTRAFQLNLSALSMLALVVGLFLIYNTITFSVVQRRELFGALRCLGVTRRELFVSVLSEAALVGALGSILGVGLGVLMGRNTVSLVSQTINDLYFTTTVRGVGLPVSSLIKGGLLGFAATILAAVPPALEAAAVQPTQALSRSGLERKARLAVAGLTLLGGLSVLLGLVIFQIPNQPVEVGFAGTFFAVVGMALMAANFFRLIIAVLTPLTGRLFGWVGRMAPRTLLSSLSRTAVAVAALMVAFAVASAVTIMIDSFRHTVTLWLEQTLQSDVYISAPSFTANTSLTEIDPAILPLLNQTAGVARVDLLRTTQVQTTVGAMELSASNNIDLLSERVFKSKIGDLAAMQSAFDQGAVILSEPLANRLNLKSGDVLSFITPQGTLKATVIGIYYDYASSDGTVMMNLAHYREWWQDQSITAIGLRLLAGDSADDVAAQLSNASAQVTDQKLVIRPNQALRADVMVIFDRTFAITAALRILATVVALIGILSTLLLLQIEKQREFGILKALGLGRGDLWKMVMLETGMMGLSAGILAAPTGVVLAIILIRVINLRSFGWTLQLALTPAALLNSVFLAFGAALLVGIIPAVRLSRLAAAEVIRYE